MAAADRFNTDGQSSPPSLDRWQESRQVWAPRWQEVADGCQPPSPATHEGIVNGLVRALSIVGGTAAVVVYAWSLGMAWQGSHTVTDRWLGELSQTYQVPMP